MENKEKLEQLKAKREELTQELNAISERETALWEQTSDLNDEILSLELLEDPNNFPVGTVVTFTGVVTGVQRNWNGEGLLYGIDLVDGDGCAIWVNGDILRQAE